MTSKSKKGLLFLLMLVFAFSLALTACSGTGERDPKGIIQDAYGDKEFRISFSLQNLSAPLKDMSYTANSIPKLHAPEKVGYIFAGWYFDSGLTIPYSDDRLYLYMKDVILYPKWIKEEFITNGTYDIGLNASIVEGSVKKGPLTDTYGGYKDISNDIVFGDCYLEKSDSDLLLRFTYDSRVIVPFMYNPMGASTKNAVYSVGISQLSSSGLYISSVIDPSTDVIKTIYFNITDFELSDTIYLTIKHTNWETIGLSDEQREKTATEYLLALNITRIIGFSRPFENPDMPLEDGNYLIKTYMRVLNNNTTMLENFNPIYSYIVASGGNYKLIKPFPPDISLAPAAGAEPGEEYYNRQSAFTKIMTYYTADFEGKTGKDEDDMRNSWNGGPYGELVYEFNSDTKKAYYTFDLGNNLKTGLVLHTISSGYMESMGNTYASGKRLILDYDHILKLGSIDYEPLSGDAFVFASEMAAYPYNPDDLASNGAAYDVINELGISSKLINYFFDASGGHLEPNSIGNKLYSSKITFSPSAGTAATPVKDMRYTVGYFDVKNEAFGYNAQSMSLCADSMTTQTFGYSENEAMPNGTGLREKYQIQVGKSFRLGQTVRLEDFYKEKIADTDFSQVEYKGYYVKNGILDFSKAVELPPQFVFSEAVTILFTVKTPDGTKTTLANIVEYLEPVITVDPKTYDKDANYKINDKVQVPKVSYKWMGTEKVLSGVFSETDDENINEVPNILYVALFNGESGTYRFLHHQQEGILSISNTFSILSQNMKIGYELQNPYGETQMYYLDFASASPEYNIYDEVSGDIVASGVIRYRTKFNREVRNPVDHKQDFRLIETIEEALEAAQKEYTFNLPMTGHSGRMMLSHYTLKTKSIVKTVRITSISEAINDIQNTLSGAPYAYINYVFTDGEDEYNEFYLYKFRFGGKTELNIAPYSAYFTGVSYIFSPSPIMGETTVIGTGSIGLHYYINDAFNIASSVRDAVDSVKSGDNTILKFNRPGTYRFSYDVVLRYDEYGGRVFAESEQTQIRLYQEFHVYDGKGEVTINFVTDGDHPFSDGELEKTVTFSLADGVTTLNKNAFHNVSDMLFAWGVSEDTTYRDMYKYYGPGMAISDYISKFNAKEITLYAMWDKGVTITFDFDKEISGQDNTVNKYVLTTNDSSVYYGYYKINLNVISVRVPEGYVHYGWECEYFPDGFVPATSNANVHAISVHGDWTIKAVFKKLITVRYVLGENVADGTWFTSDRDILEDSILDDVIDIEPKMHVPAKSGYVFKHWSLTDGGEKFDLYSDELRAEYGEYIANNLTIKLYAVFESTEL